MVIIEARVKLGFRAIITINTPISGLTFWMTKNKVTHTKT